MVLVFRLSFIMFCYISLAEVRSLIQLDQHYRKTLEKSDSLSTPFKRITRLFHAYNSKNRKHVAIINQTVTANGSDRARNAHLVIESDSFGTIKIHSIDNPVYYLCIGNDYKPRGVAKRDLETGRVPAENCIFKEYFTDKYVQFKSVKFFSKKRNTGCLAFSKYGRGRKINRSKCSHKSTLFIERKSRVIIDIGKNGALKNQLFELLRTTGHT